MSGRSAPLVLGVVVAACSFDSAGVGSADGEGGTSSSASTGLESTATTASTTTMSTTASTTAVDSTGDDPTSTGGSSSGSSEGSTAGESSSSTGDTGEGPPELGPFGDATPIAELNTEAFDDDPTLRGDQLEIYFASLRFDGGGLGEEIWRAERDSVDDPWDPPERVASLGSSGQDGWPELSHDGLVMTFSSDRDGGPGAFDIFVVEREDFDSPWSAPVRIDELSSTVPEAAAVMSEDLLEVLLAAPIPMADDIVRATRDAPDGIFGMPMPVAELNSFGRDTVPFLDVLGTRVLFASDRGGELAIWTAVREPGLAFEAPTQVLDVDGLGAEDDPWWAPDGSAIYFARMSPNNELDLYVAQQIDP